MNLMKLNETQMIGACEKCQEHASEEDVYLSFEDCIEFLSEAIGYDYHDDDLDKFIKEFVRNKESV